MNSPTAHGLPTGDVPPPDALPGQVGRYRVLARLGAGGMGTVYKAHDPDLDRTVALKLPRFDGPADARAVRVQRFQREARAAAQLWHPHVCPIYDVGEHEGQPFVVMAYVEGRSLADWLAEHGRCEDPARAVAIVRQVLDALGAVHARGLVHRDLKPGNILLDAAGRAVLADFGLARPEHDTEHLTSDGLVLGTPTYMAPEQAAGESARVGPATDLYSVGVLLYQLLAGRPPFEGPPLTVLSRIVHDAPPPPRSLRPDLDPDLDAAVLKALAKDPADRYASARAFAEALGRWAPDPAVTSAYPPITPAGSRPEGDTTRTAALAAARPRLRHPVLTRVVGVLAGLVLAALLLPCLVVGFVHIIQAGRSPGTMPAPRTGGGSGSGGGRPYDPALDRQLLEAAAKGQRVKVQELLANRANPNARDENGDTPLMKAAARGQVPVLSVLLDAWGLETNAKDSRGETALMKAAANGQLNAVTVLLHPPGNFINGRPNRPEAEVNEEDNQGQTALAKARKYPEVVKLLKEKSARE